MITTTEATPATPTKKPRRRKRGRGSIYQRKDGLWCAELPVAGAKRKYIYGKTAGEVEKKLTAAKSTLDGGGVLVEDRLTVGKVLDAFLEQRTPITRPATIGNYRRLIDQHIRPALGSHQARAFTSDTLQAFVSSEIKRGTSASMVHHLLSLLRMSFRLAKRARKVMIDPTDGVTGPKVERNIPKPLDQVETQKYLEAARAHPLAALWLISASLGLRRGEVLGLRWIDVDLETGDLHVVHQLCDATGELAAPKTKKGTRSLHLSAAARAALKTRKSEQAAQKLKLGEDWCDLDGLIFTTEIGTPLDGGTVSKMHAALCLTAKVRHVRLHDLRHGAATLMLAAGVDPATLSAKLGHAKVAFTLDTYVHPDQERLDDASERLARVLGLG